MSIDDTDKWYVYILSCNDDKLYNGCTRNLEERIKRHQKGQVKSTCKRLPVKLIQYTVFFNKYKAFDFEKYIKSGSGRAFVKKRLV